MALGDWVLFYHSGSEKSRGGPRQVSRTSYPDPTAREGDWSAVDLEAVCPLTNRCRSRPSKRDTVRDMPLVRQSRLSVSPMTGPQFRRLLALSRTVLPHP
jgi:predicted RNA-binding protein with PUA-like domain